MRESEERFRGTFENAAVGITHLDLDGHWLRVNQHFCEILGYTEGELRQKTFLNITHPADVEEDWEQYNRLLRGEIESFEIEKRYVRKDGQSLWVSVTRSAQRDAAGRALYSIAIIKDISARKQQELALRESEQRFRGTFENAAVGLSHMDTNGRWLRVNQKLCEILGYAREELLKESFLFVTHPDEREAEAQRYGRLMHGEIENYSTEKRFVRRDGRLAWLNVTRALQRDEAGRPLYSISVLQDISDRKQAEEALRESGERLRATFDHAAVGIVEYDIDGRLLASNDRVCQILGYSRVELLGMSVHELTYPEDRSHSDELNASLHEGRVDRIDYEKRYLKRDGSPLWVHLTASVIRDDAGRFQRTIGTVEDISARKRAEAEIDMLARFPAENPSPVMRMDREHRLIYCNNACQVLLKAWDCQIGQCLPEAVRAAADEAWSKAKSVETEASAVERIYSLILTPVADQQYINVYGRDITDRKQAEEKLRESEYRLRMATEATQFGTFDYHPQTGKLIWTDNAKLHFGLPPEADVNYDLFLAGVHPEDRERVGRIWQEALRPEGGGNYLTEYRTIGIQDGKERWLEARGQTYFDAQGRPSRLIGATLDITERKRTEAALREANERLTEVDRRKDEFLAMLAHELRNPLAPIRYAVQMLNLSGAPQTQLQKQREMIDRQVSHMGRLLDDLLDISRVTRGKITLKREVVDLRTIASQALDSLRPLIEGRGQHVMYEAPSSPLLVDGDPTRLEQIIRNLLHNANKYTEVGGCIKLSLTLDTDHQQEWRVVVRVNDSGIGIAADVLPLVFEAFVQADQGLARSQGGLGIGLAMVRNLVQLHGGSVQAHSAGAGRGSEFVVRLPLATPDAMPGSAETETAESGLRASSCRVLVVDDNEDSAASLSDLLGLWGHEVRTAYDGPHALEAARQWRPEVILLDIGLPGMDGYEVAERLRQEPATRKAYVVALTGYGGEEDRRRALEAGFNQHLIKPVELDRLQAIFSGACSA